MKRTGRLVAMAALGGCAVLCVSSAVSACALAARNGPPAGRDVVELGPTAGRDVVELGAPGEIRLVRRLFAPRGSRAAGYALGEAARLTPPTSFSHAFDAALTEATLAWAEQEADRAPSTSEREAEEPKPKSPMKAALMSAIVPGLGQFMTGHPKMGAAYLGVEAVGWTGYSILRTDGYDKRHDARLFADDHYDSTVYNVKKDESSSDPPNKELPYNDDLEYYEDISKLNEIIWGWDDHTPDVDQVSGQLAPGTSERREVYKGMRNDGNDDLRNSRNIGMVLVVNHIVSAVHAFKLVQWYNKNLNREFSGLKFKVKQTPDKQGLFCTVTKRF